MVNCKWMPTFPSRTHRLVVLIPAHNEERHIAAALRSLAAQTRRPDEIIVVADRCTDNTAAVAKALGANVIEIDGNGYRKAGALNAALREVLSRLRDTDEVMMMDADTVLVTNFVESAHRRLHTHEPGQRPVGAVGGVFLAAE